VLRVLLEKRTTTYKQVSDLITASEARKLALVEYSDFMDEGGINPATNE